MRIDLALVGFGNVARRFVHLIDERRDSLMREFDIDLRILGIATRRHGTMFDIGGIDALAAARAVGAGKALTGLASSIEDSQNPGAPQIIEALARSTADRRIVVETTTLDIAGGQPAIDHVRQALDKGCDVVTANKGPAAFAYEELSTLARTRGLAFLFEGAVMDGIPVFNMVRRTMPTVRIEGFRGVVNSTTNHILTALEDGDEFAPALARMQAEGIAEADPSLDVDGWDAAAKASALANVFLGARITPHDVDREGIGPDTAFRAQETKARGRRLRLVASAARGEAPRVGLVELPSDDLLAGLRGTSNALILDTDTLGRVAITQIDGGLTHTAFAVLSDVVEIASSFPLRASR